MKKHVIAFFLIAVVGLPAMARTLVSRCREMRGDLLIV